MGPVHSAVLCFRRWTIKTAVHTGVLSSSFCPVKSALPSPAGNPRSTPCPVPPSSWAALSAPRSWFPSPALLPSSLCAYAVPATEETCGDPWTLLKTATFLVGCPKKCISSTSEYILRFASSPSYPVLKLRTAVIPHAAPADTLLKKGIIFLARELFLPHSQSSVPWKEQESPLIPTFKNGSLWAQFGRGLKKAAVFQTQAAHTALGSIHNPC